MPRAIKKRKERKEFHKEILKEQSEKRRERRIRQGLKVRDRENKTTMEKSNTMKYKKRLKSLRKPGNEEKLKEYKDKITNENRRYMAKLRKEIKEGTASEKRLEAYERRLQKAKQRKINKQHHNV